MTRSSGQEKRRKPVTFQTIRPVRVGALIQALPREAEVESIASKVEGASLGPFVSHPIAPRSRRRARRYARGRLVFV